ncbi:MAG: hypothetical protein LBL93_05275 [Ruminococcus sp.]|nr:hypothetical protein [Ruminococcus sp.]
MTKLNTYLLIACSLLFSIVIVEFSLLMNAVSSGTQTADNPVKGEPLSTAISSIESETSHIVVYTLKEHQGKLALFVDGSNIPSQIFDTPIELLPEYDRGMLKDGITVSNETDLQKLIEDYDG